MFGSGNQQIIKNSPEGIDRLREALWTKADAVVIGAEPAFPLRQDFVYTGRTRDRYFRLCPKRYHFNDNNIQAALPYDTLEERWALRPEHIYINRYLDCAKAGV